MGKEKKNSKSPRKQSVAASAPSPATPASASTPVSAAVASPTSDGSDPPSPRRKKCRTQSSEDLGGAEATFEHVRLEVRDQTHFERLASNVTEQFYGVENITEYTRKEQYGIDSADPDFRVLVQAKYYVKTPMTASLLKKHVTAFEEHLGAGKKWDATPSTGTLYAYKFVLVVAKRMGHLTEQIKLHRDRLKTKHVDFQVLDLDKIKDAVVGSEKLCRLYAPGDNKKALKVREVARDAFCHTLLRAPLNEDTVPLIQAALATKLKTPELPSEPIGTVGRDLACVTAVDLHPPADTK